MKCYAIEKKVRPTPGRNISFVGQTERQIGMKWLFAAGFVVALLCAAPTYGQEQNCLRCFNHQCQFSGLVGACACTETIGGGCAVCGTCVAPHCEVQCDAKVPSTPDQLQAHPWMTDQNLSTKVSAYSQTLGELLSSEQKLLKAGWCVNFRRGEDYAIRDDKTTDYKWEMIPRGDVDEYRVKQVNDSKEEKIILMKTQWIILSGEDFGDLIARGEITSAKAR